MAATVTTQKIHSALQRGGHTRSVWNKSQQVRGWGHASAGYKVEPSCGGYIVRHVSDSHTKRDDAAEWRQVSAYHDTLRAAGLSVRVEWTACGHVVRLSPPAGRDGLINATSTDEKSK